MSFTMSVSADFKQVEKMLNDLDKNLVPKAAVAALNETATAVRKEAVNELAVEMETGLSKSGFRRSIAIRRARRNSLFAELVASGKPLPRILYGARKVAGGVSYVTRKGRSVRKGAFIATMPTGHKGVYVRAKNKHRRGDVRKVKSGKSVGQSYRPQLPIIEQYGPALPSVFLERKIQDSMQRHASKIWPVKFQQKLDWLLSKYQ